jgi:hypothetical protein
MSRKKNTVTISRTKRSRPKNEGEYLNSLAHTAKMAIANTSKGMARNFLGMLKIQDWAREYPLKTTGFAAVFGFVIGGKIVSPAPAELEISKSPSPTKSVGKNIWFDLTAMLTTAAVDILKDAAHTWLAQNIPSKKDTAPKSSIP